MKAVNFFLFCSVSIYALGCNMEVEAEYREKEDVPLCVQQNLRLLIPQIRAHQSESTVTFAFITDLHNESFSDTYKYNNKNIHKISRIVTALNEISKELCLSCVVIGGDYLWNTTSTSKIAAIEALDDFSLTMSSLKGVPILCIKGNHDDNSIAGLQNTLSSEEFYEYCAKRFENETVSIDKTNPFGCYGFFDYKPGKVRFVFINSVDLPWKVTEGILQYKGQWHKGLSQKQLIFLSKALKFDEDGWGVVLLSHHPLISIEGYDISPYSYITPENGGAQLLGIITAFKRSSTYSGEVYGDFESHVAVNYEDNKGTEIICLLNGHIHSDRNAERDGMLFCSTTSATLGNDNILNTNGLLFNPVEGTSNETAFDIVTIDRRSGIVYFDRYGFGESREFKYK